MKTTSEYDDDAVDRTLMTPKPWGEIGFHFLRRLIYLLIFYAAAMPVLIMEAAPWSFSGPWFYVAPAAFGILIGLSSWIERVWDPPRRLALVVAIFAVAMTALEVAFLFHWMHQAVFDERPYKLGTLENYSQLVVWFIFAIASYFVVIWLLKIRKKPGVVTRT